MKYNDNVDDFTVTLIQRLAGGMSLIYNYIHCIIVGINRSYFIL